MYTRKHFLALTSIIACVYDAGKVEREKEKEWKFEKGREKQKKEVK